MARDGTGVRRASKSSIEIGFSYLGEWRRERIKLAPTEDNLRRALTHKKNIETAIINGTFNYAATFPNSKQGKAEASKETPTMLLSAYLTNWLNRKRNELHSSTTCGYDSIINMIIAELGTIPLHELSRPHIRDWISQATVSNKTISNRLSPLRTALDDAVMDGLIEVNPIYNWKWRNRKQQQTQPDTDPFSKEEQRRIFKVAGGQEMNLFKFLLWTGLRPSEAAALNWSDINLITGTVNINKGFTQAATESEATKTGAGNRTLKLLPPALDAIRAQIKWTQEKGEEVFQHPRHKERWQGDKPIRNKWAIVLRKAKVRYRKTYQLRHTFASMMISAEENIRWLSMYLGHSDLTTTLRIYAHWLADADPDAGMKAFEKFGL